MILGIFLNEGKLCICRAKSLICGVTLFGDDPAHFQGEDGSPLDSRPKHYFSYSPYIGPWNQNVRSFYLRGLLGS